MNTLNAQVQADPGNQALIAQRDDLANQAINKGNEVTAKNNEINAVCADYEAFKGEKATLEARLNQNLAEFNSPQ